MQLFDSHAHLQDERFADVAPLLDRAKAQNVAAIVCCGSTEDDWERVVAIAGMDPMVIPAFGIHPWYVGSLSSHWRDDLTRLLGENPNAAVGEIGIDKMVDTDFGLQMEVFASQIEIARQLSRPVSIHCRKAWEPLMRTLGDIARSGPIRGVIHSYSGSRELVSVLESWGLHLSFSGSITYDRNRRGREAVKAVSHDRLLIETDSPDILPRGVDVPLNEPSFLWIVNREVALLRGEDPVGSARITMRNATTLFLGR